MYIEAELVLKSYKPLKLEEGMLFVNKIARTDAVELFILEEIPDDEEKFVVTNGYPMEPYIIQHELLNNTETPIILATPEEIGWWDYEELDEFTEISLEEINNVISQFTGLLEIYMEDDKIGYPLLIENTVVLKYLTDDEEEISCDNCGSTDIIQNSSGDIMCENCGWEENED
jgi:hypothetical protein